MKNVIITGSSNGFGLKAAKDFADKGNKVFATMRNPNGKNAKVKEELEAYSSHIKVVDMDVTNDMSVTNAMNTIFSEAENIDILINNVGIYKAGDFFASTVEDWQKLRGVGPSFSKRIVKFRDRLGGFYSIEQVGETYGLPYVITNCSNNYGANQFPEKLIPLFINKNIRQMIVIE